MELAKVKPNHVTCSILLKSLTQHSTDREIFRTMKLVDNMDQVVLLAHWFVTVYGQ
jgi:hypothetical protein